MRLQKTHMLMHMHIRSYVCYALIHFYASMPRTQALDIAWYVHGNMATVRPVLGHSSQLGGLIRRREGGNLGGPFSAHNNARLDNPSDQALMSIIQLFVAVKGMGTASATSLSQTFGMF